MGWYARGGKRLLDLSASAFGLVLLAPVLLALAALVRIRLGRPVLFVRYGERMFQRCSKFRN